MGVRGQKRSQGENHHNAKLTEEDIRFMRFMYHVLRPEAKARHMALTARGLAEKFGVTEKVAQDIVQYRTWRHVPDNFKEIER